VNTSAEPANNHSPAQSSERKRPSVLLLACVAVASVALLGGSLLWLLRSNGGAPVRSKVRATVTATGTAVPTWVPTEVTPPPNAIFYDTFVNNARGWSLSGSDGYFRILVNNTLILADTNPNTPLIESVPTSVNLDNYVISVDFTINQGDAYDSLGLYLRGDSTLDHDYRIDINGDSTFDVAKEWLDTSKTAQTTLLIPSQHTGYLNPPGQQNTLTVLMIGPTLTVEINGFLVASITDASYPSGQVALFARHGNSPDGIIVSFSRVEIDRVASPFATPTPSPTPTATAGHP